MKKQFIFSLLFLSMAFPSLAQENVKDFVSGIWTEKENGITEIKWSFNSNGSFNNIAYWNNPVQIGGVYRTGKFSFDEKTNTLNMVFDQSYTATNQNGELHPDSTTKEWVINSVTESEMVITRPVLFEYEKNHPTYNGSSVQVTFKKVIVKIQ